MPEISQAKLKEKLIKMPEITTQIKLSRDGKWVIVKTIQTQIYSKAYFDKVLKGKERKIEVKHTGQLF